MQRPIFLIAGSLHPETLAALQPRMKSLLTDPAAISVEALENQNHQQSKPLHQENSKYNAKNSLVSDDFEEIPSESHFIRKRRAHIPPQNIVLANAGCL